MDSAAAEFVPTSASTATQPADVGKQSKAKRTRRHKPKSAPKPQASLQDRLLSEQLRNRELECVVCMQVIGWKGKIWNCMQCRQPQHLTCIQKWRQKAGDSWPCPACSYIYTDVPRYYCFCGKVENPNSTPGMQPHSCGETCGRNRGLNCPHLCPLLCHPGQCPPCTSLSAPIQCYCGKLSFQVMCKDNAKPRSCGQTCGRLLPCRIHHCSLPCHEGDCGDCRATKEMTCYCGKQTKSVSCAVRNFTCQEECGKALSCGLHTCNRNCHPGSCGRCPRDPALVTTCPCGKNQLSVLLIEERKSCTDPIPTCYTPCQQLQACGHQCQAMCHFGRCPPCKEKVSVLCRCGSMTISTICSKASDAKCQKICKTMKSCNKHKCDEICCPERGKVRNSNGKHLCFVICDKPLDCGQHACPLFCHLGNCESCNVVIREPITCACGRTRREPPIRCGSVEAVVQCRLVCEKRLPCGHTCRAKCHSDACPPCLELTTKPCKCGKELRDSIPCSANSGSCGKICYKPRNCGHKCCLKCHEGDCNSHPCVSICGHQKSNCEHNCQLPCHGSDPCPSLPCQTQVLVHCACGAQAQTSICSNRIIPPCDPECERIIRNAKLEAALNCEKPVESYSPELLVFARNNLDFVKKVERKAQSILKSKEKVTLLPPMNQAQRAFCHDYLTTHFEFETEAVDKEPNRTIVVYLTPRARLPSPLLSSVPPTTLEVIDEPRETIAHILFYQLQMQDTTEELKDTLSKFAGEFYVKWVNDHSAMACFYNLQRCMAAKEMLESRPGPFSVCRLVQESKLPKSSPAPPRKFTNSRKKATEVSSFEEHKPS